MHECKFEDKVIEMHGDLKTLVAEFKSMNGQLRRTKHDFENHNDESKIFRHKVDTIWTVIHTVKWALGSSLAIYMINRFL